MQTGTIIDFYDDPTGIILKQKLHEDQVPEFIKTASHLEGQNVPDDVFALVMVDGGEKLRKFACADKGNTALSVIYFMENHHKLPEEAQKVAAANLLEACDAYGLAAPFELTKIARGRMEALRSGFTKARNAAAYEKANRGVEPIAKMMGYERLGKWMGSLGARDVAAAGGLLAAGGGAGYALGKHRGKKEKTAGMFDRAGKGISNWLREGSQLRAKLKARANLPFKKQSSAPSELKSSVYVDVTGKEPPVQIEKVSYRRHCLPDRFPIDSYGQVQQAVDWFDKYASSLHPEQRREYCQNLSPRASQLGIETTRDIQKYAGEGYAPDGEVKIAVETRKQMWRDGDSQRSLLDGLLEKKAEVPPDVFCEALKQFDEDNGLHHYWDDGIYDPWYSTYGIEKRAEWSFETHGDKINERQLKQMTDGSFQLFKEKFGEELAEGLRKKPIEIFDSLPLDYKRIIMRLANDPQPSPHLTLA